MGRLKLVRASEPPRSVTPRMSRARFVVVHLPAFRLERCGFQADEPAGLVDEVKNATRLVALTPAGREAGLDTHGMTATEARALVPDVPLEPLDVEGEATDLAALTEVFRALSDQVVALPPQAVALEVSGTSRLFGGEQALLARALELAAELGHVARVAMADDVLAAHILARAGQQPAQLVPPGQLAAALAPLPVGALGASSTLLQALTQLGIRTVAQWASLDPASVVGRFGEEGRQLHRLARGRVVHAHLDDPGPAGAIRTRVLLPSSTELLSQVRFALGGMVGELCQDLEQRGRAAVRLALRLVLEKGPAWVARVRVGRPSRDPAVLLRVLELRLENLRLASPIEELRLEVEEHTHDEGRQLRWMDRSEAVEPLPDLLARMTDALGDDAVFSPVLVDRWRPEASYQPVPFGEDRAWVGEESVDRSASIAPRRVDPVEAHDAWQRDLPLPRPTLLLHQPLPVDVRTDEAGVPVAVHLERGWEPLERATGPEHLCGEWWTADPLDRHYWVVALRDGRTGWIYSAAGRWFHHGWFD